MNIENKIIIVTGCASGIGAATARQLKAQNATVIGFDIKEPTENVDEFITIDLSKEEAIVKAVNQYKGTADAICNIAGVPPTAPAMVQMNVNFFGLRTFTNLMIPKLNKGASIVNLASLAGGKFMERIPLIKQVMAFENAEATEDLLKANDVYGENSYAFSKEMVIVWTMKMAPILREKCMSIKALSPGPVKTPILQDFMDTIVKKQTFLCSKDAQWINGRNIVIDGGLSASRMGAGMGL